MRRTIPTIVILSACAIVFASCGKESLTGVGHSSAIKLTVSGVQTKARVITDRCQHSETIYDYIEDAGFNISAYVTETWRRDVIGASPDIAPGIFIDPGYYRGPYDESTYPDEENYKLQDVRVTYVEHREDGEESWRITGNDGYGYANHKFSWVNGVAMNFFAYAPLSSTGEKAPGLTINKADDSVDSNYPFSYKTPDPDTDGVIGPSDCKDLIFAFTQNTATFESDHTSSQYGKLKPDSKDKIDIRFYHALAQIRFCLSTDDGTFDPSYKLVSVKLKGIKSKGDCTFEGATNTFDWRSTALDVQKDYLQTFNVSFESGTAPEGWTKGSYHGEEYNLFTNTADVLFVIPQSLSECEVELKIERGGSIITLNGSLPVTTEEDGLFWEAGKYYTYKISMSGASDNLSLSMTLADWAEREDYIPIY